MNRLYFLCVLLFVSFATFSQNHALIPIELTCEYLSNPSGIDIKEPRFGWKLETTDTDAYNQKQTAYRILVSSDKRWLKTKISTDWDSGWIESEKTQQVEYSGVELKSDATYFWKVFIRDEKGIVTSSETATFKTGILDDKLWSAKWIGSDEEFVPSAEGSQIADPWLRKTFELKKQPGKANIFVASVGYHELYVNGQRIDNHVLAPAVSDHTKRARYISYDIAPALKKGNNVIAIWLGTSWSIYAPYLTPDKPRTPIVLAQTEIYDKRHKLQTKIITDNSWKTHPSPNKLIGSWGFGVPGGYGGELWDDNKAIDNWNTISLDNTQWKNAVEYNPNLVLSAQMTETNMLFDDIIPVQIDKLYEGIYKVDMGKNYAGWTRIKVKGNPGDTVRFLISEREEDEMTFSLNSAFVIGKSGEGVFQNRFNYGSGRWITVKGVTEAPLKEDIKGWMVRTNYKDAATFECSDSLQNWIYNTVKWTFENLSLGGYIVDCPQRERFGYGGDAHATSETGMLNYQLGSFYTKWMEDWRDVQGTEPMVGNMNDSEWARKHEGSGRIIGGGVLPQTAPTYHGGGGPAWGGIVVTLPWFMYEYYGDTRILNDNFELVEGWLAFLDSHVENGMLQRYGGPWDFLGDWLWPQAGAQGMNNNSDENLFFNNCYWIYNLKTAAKYANVIGKTEEAEKWTQQAEKSQKIIHDRFFHPDEFNYSDKSMRSLSAALYGDIMPTHLRDKVIDSLEKEILINQGGHIDVGITGGAMLFKVLRDEGRDDLIYSMTSQTTYPSWGLMRESGATTIWEMWEKDLPGHSLLHSSYLYPGAWYIDGIAGIKKFAEFAGYNKFEIRIPKLDESQIKWAKAEYNSNGGLIKAYWKKENCKTELNVTVPPNSNATVYFPKSGNKVFVNSEYAKEADEPCDKHHIYHIGSGKYQFKD